MMSNYRLRGLLMSLPFIGRLSPSHVYGTRVHVETRQLQRLIV